MSFLAQACVGHSGSSTDPAAVCCTGYTKWTYDAKNGIPYQGFMCWSASCAEQGQWAGPNGVGNSCCTGLVNTGGICSTPTAGGGGNQVPTCAMVGKVPLAGQSCCTGLARDTTGVCNVPKQGGGFFGNVDTTTMLMAGGAILLLMMLGGKKR